MVAGNRCTIPFCNEICTSKYVIRESLSEYSGNFLFVDTKLVATNAKLDNHRNKIHTVS